MKINDFNSSVDEQYWGSVPNSDNLENPVK